MVPTPNEQHNFIYNYMLPTMVTILSQVKDTLVSVEDDISMKTLTIRSIAPYQKVGFNWNDFFYNLSLSGLQNCVFFQNEIGTFDKFGFPLITVDQIKMDFYNQYNNYGHIYLHN
jgi:hypothetical protein